MRTILGIALMVAANAFATPQARPSKKDKADLKAYREVLAALQRCPTGLSVDDAAGALPGPRKGAPAVVQPAATCPPHAELEAKRVQLLPGARRAASYEMVDRYDDSDHVTAKFVGDTFRLSSPSFTAEHAHSWLENHADFCSEFGMKRLEVTDGKTVWSVELGDDGCRADGTLKLGLVWSAAP